MVGGKEHGIGSWENRLLHEIDGYFWAIQPVLCFWSLWLFGHPWGDSSPTGAVHQLCDQELSRKYPRASAFLYNEDDHLSSAVFTELYEDQMRWWLWKHKKKKKKSCTYVISLCLNHHLPITAILPSSSLFVGSIWRPAASVERWTSSLSWGCQSHSSLGP